MAKIEKELIYAQYSTKEFLKVKAAWNISKILLTFVQIESKKHIDCYLNISRAKIIIEDFYRGDFDRKREASIEAAKQKMCDYPAYFWQSPYGGSKEKENIISRYFTIAPGMKKSYGYGYCVFTAYEYPAEVNAKGGYSPIKNSKPSLTLRVPFSTRDDFREFIIELKEAVERYYDWRYSYENCKSGFKKEERNEDTSLPTLSKQETNEETEKQERVIVSIGTMGKVIQKKADAGHELYLVDIVENNTGEKGRLFLNQASKDWMTSSGSWDSFCKAAETGVSIKIIADKKGNDYLFIKMASEN